MENYYKTITFMSYVATEHVGDNSKFGLRKSYSFMKISHYIIVAN